MTPVASPSRWPSSQAKLGLFPAAGNTACGVLQYHLIPGLPSNPILHQMLLLLPPHRTSSAMPLCSSHIVPLLNHLFLPESQETCLPDASFPLSGASFSQSYPRWDPKPSYREELLPIFLWDVVVTSYKYAGLVSPWQQSPRGWKGEVEGFLYPLPGPNC